MKTRTINLVSTIIFSALSIHLLFAQKIVIFEDQLTPVESTTQKVFLNSYSGDTETREFLLCIDAERALFQKFCTKTKKDAVTNEQSLISVQRLVGSHKQHYFNFVPIFGKDVNAKRTAAIPQQCLALNSNQQLVLRKGQLEHQYRGAVLVQSEGKFEFVDRPAYSNLEPVKLVALQQQDLNLFQWMKAQSASGETQLLGESLLLDWNLEPNSTLFYICPPSEKGNVQIAIVTKEPGTQDFRHFTIQIDAAALKLMSSSLMANRASEPVQPQPQPQQTGQIRACKCNLYWQPGLKSLGPMKYQEARIEPVGLDFDWSDLCLFRAQENGLLNVDAYLGSLKRGSTVSQKGSHIKLLGDIALAVSWSGRLVLRPSDVAQNALSRYIEFKNYCAEFRAQGHCVFPKDVQAVNILESQDIDFLEILRSEASPCSADCRNILEVLSSQQLKVDNTFLTSFVNLSKTYADIFIYSKNLADHQDLCYLIRIDLELFLKIHKHAKAKFGASAVASAQSNSSSSARSSAQPNQSEAPQASNPTPSNGPNSFEFGTQLAIYKNTLEWRPQMFRSSVGFGNFYEAVIKSSLKDSGFSQFYLYPARHNGLPALVAYIGSLRTANNPQTPISGHIACLRPIQDPLSVDINRLIPKGENIALAVNSIGKLVLRRQEIADASLSRHLERLTNYYRFRVGGVALFPLGKSSLEEIQKDDINFIDLLVECLPETSRAFEHLKSNQLNADTTVLQIFASRGTEFVYVFIYSTDQAVNQETCYTLRFHLDTWKKMIVAADSKFKSQKVGNPQSTTRPTSSSVYSTASIPSYFGSGSTAPNSSSSSSSSSTTTTTSQPAQGFSSTSTPYSSDSTSAGFHYPGTGFSGSFNSNGSSSTSSLPPSLAQNEIRLIRNIVSVTSNYGADMNGVVGQYKYYTIHLLLAGKPYSISTVHSANGKLSAKLSTDKGLVELDQLSKKGRTKEAEKLYSYNGLKLYQDSVLLTVNGSGKLALCNSVVNKGYKGIDFLSIISSYISTDEAAQISQQVHKDLRGRTFDRKLTMGIVLRSSGQQEIQLILLTINKDHGLVSYTVQMHSSLWDRILQDAHKQLSSAASATSETGAQRSSGSDSEDSGSDSDKRGIKRKAEQETESVGNKRAKTSSDASPAQSNNKPTVIFSKNSAEIQCQKLELLKYSYKGNIASCFSQNSQPVTFDLFVEYGRITGKVNCNNQIFNLRSLQRRAKHEDEFPLYTPKGLKTFFENIIISINENNGRIIFVNKDRKCKKEVDLLNALQSYQLSGNQSADVLRELNGIHFPREATTAVMLSSPGQEESLLIFSYSFNDDKIVCYVITMSSSDWNYTLRDARTILNQ